MKLSSVLTKVMFTLVVAVALMLSLFGCGVSRVRARQWFYVRSVYEGYVVSVDASNADSIDISKPDTIENATSLANRLNKDVGNRFAEPGLL